MSVSPLACDIAEQLDAASAIWERYRHARIFVAGGTGMVGKWLTELFLAANDRFALNASLTLLTRDPQRFATAMPHLAAHPALHVQAGDVRHFLFPGGKFTHILHAATASSGETPVPPTRMADTILRGTQRVLAFAATQPHARLLYVSSAAVVGRTRSSATPIREEDGGAPQLHDPNLAYDAAKRMGEALCMIQHQETGLSVSIARCFALVGAHLPRDRHFAIGNFIRDALAGDTITVQGDGRPTRSYLYLADLARYLWVMLAEAAAGSVYHVGSPHAVTMAELAATVARVLRPDATIHIAEAMVDAAPSLNYQVPDTGKLTAHLGLSPCVGLEEAIRRTAQWYRAHPATTATPSTASVLAQPDAVIFDFDGVMTDNRVFVSQEGVESVACNRSDGLGIGFLKACGIPLLVLSKEPNPVVAQRCKKLGLECLQGIDHKQITLDAWLNERGFAPERTIYLGNDVNDLECMRYVGLPVAVADAYAEVKAVAAITLTQRGGHGAVRELADLILASRDGQQSL